MQTAPRSCLLVDVLFDIPIRPRSHNHAANPFLGLLVTRFYHTAFAVFPPLVSFLIPPRVLLTMHWVVARAVWKQKRPEV